MHSVCCMESPFLHLVKTSRITGCKQHKVKSKINLRPQSYCTALYKVGGGGGLIECPTSIAPFIGPQTSQRYMLDVLCVDRIFNIYLKSENFGGAPHHPPTPSIPLLLRSCCTVFVLQLNYVRISPKHG